MQPDGRWFESGLRPQNGRSSSVVERRKNVSPNLVVAFLKLQAERGSVTRSSVKFGEVTVFNTGDLWLATLLRFIEPRSEQDIKHAHEFWRECRWNYIGRGFESRRLHQTGP